MNKTYEKKLKSNWIWRAFTLIFFSISVLLALFIGLNSASEGIMDAIQVEEKRIAQVKGLTIDFENSIKFRILEREGDIQKIDEIRLEQSKLKVVSREEMKLLTEVSDEFRRNVQIESLGLGGIISFAILALAYGVFHVFMRGIAYIAFGSKED